MAIEQIDVEQIQDNPYQARQVYHRQDIDGLAVSIKTHGLLEVPVGRRRDGNIELAFGHLRKRAFLKLTKEYPKMSSKMPVDIRDLTDEEMALFALEENLRRRDITPIEVARAVDNYLTHSPDKTEMEVAKQLNMTQGNVSNMRRVLELPAKILEKVDQGRITFTQARELIMLQKLDNSEELMLTAIRGIRTEGRGYGHADTVEGMQACIHDVISNRCRPLDIEYQGYRWDLIFDTRAVGCLNCEKMVRTHPTKSATAHYWLDDKCWNRHQEEQRAKVSAEAKARMEADILRRVTELAPKPIIHVELEKFSEIEASYSGDRISKDVAIRKPSVFEGKQYTAVGIDSKSIQAYQLLPKEEFTGEVRSYRVPKEREDEEYYQSLRDDPNGFYHGMLVKHRKSDHVLVGPPVSFVLKTADVKPASTISQEIPQELGEKADETDKWMERQAEALEARADARDRELEAEKETALAEQEAIPEDILSLAREKAGTRAEVLDLKDIGAGYYQEVRQGYALLDGFDRALEHIVDPDECLERCTHGFHFAFDSRQREPRTRYVCSDTKCLTNKKAAFTRAKNAEGQARKNAERKAIKQAIAQTTTLDRPRIKLILLAQVDGSHITKHYYGLTDGKNPETWLWEKLSAGTPAIERKDEDLFKRIDKLPDEELARLVVEFMFYYLTDKGDIGRYEIGTTRPLNWMGIGVNVEQREDT